MTTQEIAPKRGVVKQVLSGDSVVIRGLTGAPPPEKQISFSGITAPKLARRANETTVPTKDEPYAWDAREYLRKRLVGEEVWFISEKPPNVAREYGTIYLGKDFNSAENITESLISEGLVTVRREGIKQTPEVLKLIELEDAAKAAGKGKWSNSPASEHVRDIKWTIEQSQMQAFVEKHKKKPIKAIIEHVRDGSTVRAMLLPDFYPITLMISGIRCPSSGKPDGSKVEYADEARFFVEIRLLQRDVEVILESSTKTNFVGTILHPKGNIAEALLKEGLAHCFDSSLVYVTSGADKLRKAETLAKQAKKRLWKNRQAKVPQITGKEKEFTATVTEIVNGDAIVVKLQNGQYKKLFLSSIRPPKEANRALDDDGKPAPRAKGFRPLYDIPWMFEAREYLRKKLVGKKVHVNIDYIQEAKDNFPEKTCATVTIGGKNVAEALVSKGLATVVKYRPDDEQRSSKYDDLMSAENKAEKMQVGVHSKKDSATQRVTEVDAARAKLELSSFQRAQRIDAIVEFVASGSRLRLYIPKSNCLCTLLLGGINCPRASRSASNAGPAVPGEPFGDEALLFTKEKCLQREVSIQVDSHDKAGNFIGWLWVDNINMSVALVNEGFASVHFSGEKSNYGNMLKQAEESAKKQRLRIWKDYVEEKVEEKKEEESKAPVERKVNFEEVIVTEVTPTASFFAQKVAEGKNVEALFAKLRQEFQANPPLPGAYTPKKGDVCAAKFTADDEWYRAKVEKVQGGKATVHYFDYGNRETLPTTRLASLPAAYASEKPFATEYVFPYIQLPKDEEYAEVALKYLKEDVSQGKLLLNVEFKNQGAPPAATLHLSNSPNGDIMENLITEGYFLVENIKRRSNKLLEAYKAAQETAKKNHSNIWEYGDITEDDAKEFGLGK